MGTSSKLRLFTSVRTVYSLMRRSCEYKNVICSMPSTKWAMGSWAVRETTEATDEARRLTAGVLDVPLFLLYGDWSDRRR